MLEKYLYLKLCWNRANSHTAIPSSIIEKILLVGVFLKVFSINNYNIVAVLGGLLVAFMLFLGHFDLKKGVANAETSLNNAYNPELQQLVKVHSEKRQ